LGTKSPASFPRKQDFRCVVTIHCWRTPLGKDPWKLIPGVLQVLPHLPFPFTEFALHSFAVINFICENSLILIPMSPPKKRLVWSWGPPIWCQKMSLIWISCYFHFYIAFSYFP
jgi:hypothetical protein